MNYLVGCREIESLCRQRAISDRGHSWKWLGEADRWRDLARREAASRFQDRPMHQAASRKKRGLQFGLLGRKLRQFAWMSRRAEPAGSPGRAFFRKPHEAPHG